MKHLKSFKNDGALLFFFLLLSACADGNHYAPVTEISTIEPIPRTGQHRVTRGETLYEISWRYGMDYRTVAARNHLPSPYTVRSGEVISLRGKVAQPNVVRQPKAFTWVWPVQGRVVKPFSAFNKGINITGDLGDPIYASAAGKVVYCGNGLRGYGNLIIIKHNSLYLSAYAHNKDIFVKEGEWVKQAQKIADMGKTGTNKVMLHFEIRRAGKPVNPLSLLNIIH